MWRGRVCLWSLHSLRCWSALPGCVGAPALRPAIPEWRGGGEDGLGCSLSVRLRCLCVVFGLVNKRDERNELNALLLMLIVTEEECFCFVLGEGLPSPFVTRSGS